MTSNPQSSASFLDQLCNQEAYHIRNQEKQQRRAQAEINTKVYEASKRERDTFNAKKWGRTPPKKPSASCDVPNFSDEQKPPKKKKYDRLIPSYQEGKANERLVNRQYEQGIKQQEKFNIKKKGRANSTLNKFCGIEKKSEGFTSEFTSGTNF